MHVETLAGRSSLSSIRRLIRAELNSIGAPSAQAFDCLVAVTEACTNALLHGRGDETTPPAKIAWDIGPARAHFEIVDYSTEAAAEPPRLEGESLPRDGGYGLKMMRELMDEVDIVFGPRGTTVSMTKRLSSVTTS